LDINANGERHAMFTAKSAWKDNPALGAACRNAILVGDQVAVI
jgi:hypothetical protein